MGRIQVRPPNNDIKSLVDVITAQVIKIPEALSDKGP